MQYHANWQRLHHIDVGRQQTVHGWWITFPLAFMVTKESGGVKAENGKEGKTRL